MGNNKMKLYHRRFSTQLQYVYAKGIAGQHGTQIVKVCFVLNSHFKMRHCRRNVKCGDMTLTLVLQVLS